MSSSGCHLSLLVFVVLAVLFENVVSNVDAREFANNFVDVDVPETIMDKEEKRYIPLNGLPSYKRHRFLRPVEDTLWTSPSNLGQVAGVAVDPEGRPVIFHRGYRKWDGESFDQNAEFQKRYLGPIMQETVLTLDPLTGDVIQGWGNDSFFLPHGIHIDNSGNVWLTDVALHQVFKYTLFGEQQLVLGQRFQPGNDMMHFCQPTAVATMSSGDVAIADGYCNSRIVLFTPDGVFKQSIRERFLDFNVPHGLTILPDDIICVADRENTRVVCINTNYVEPVGIGYPIYVFRHRNIGRVFGITSYDGIIYGVAEPDTLDMPYSRGFSVDPVNHVIDEPWGPKFGSFSKPHAIAICPNGTALYVAEIGPNRVTKFKLNGLRRIFDW